ncbi:hypothetical protein GDO78_005074 [Eleutherodactylus coqui]|uniref:Secreted protein n=1 Tax=Eleutherodactylus coqui TaxID=57060 RepID=A0A8J6FK92_ELECQ|nr:hypothetical protein GDO78_005074 [Eleutherodactylus coqui]
MGKTILIFNIALWVLEETGGQVGQRELKYSRGETEQQQPESAYRWRGTRLTASVMLTTDIPESRPCTRKRKKVGDEVRQARHIALKSNKGGQE